MRTIGLLFVLLMAISPLAAEQYFILFDANCMQRLEYEQAISQQPRMAYFSYQIALPNDSYLTLETGVEGSVSQAYLPAGYLACSDPRINDELADRINGNTDRVFMLVPDGAGAFFVQPVTMASVRRVVGNQVNYESPLASFSFDTKNGVIGENLSINNPGATVFFEGRDNALCTRIYLFRQLMPRNAYPVIDYKLSEELGVIERRLGSDGNSTLGGVVVLRRVNGLPLNSYLAAECAEQTAPAIVNTPTTTAGPQTYSGSPTIGVPTYGGTAPVSPIPAATPPATTVEAPLHTVARGETLYGLSRQYGVSVDQIKEWNNLNNNMINVGQPLRVGEGRLATATPAAADVAALNPGSQGNAVPYYRGSVANSNPGSAQPVPYEQNPTITTPTPNDSEDYYIVQPGETVASVALRLGYTEARFREINDLGPREVIRVGQRLKTNDCNCPAIGAAPTTSAIAPNTLGNAPATYGQALVAPATYGQAPTGTAVGPTANRAPAQPQTFGQSPSAPGTFQSAQPTTNPRAGNQAFNNDPGFSAVIPEAYQPPRQSMSQLEGGSSNAAPATYGSAASTPNPYGNTRRATPETYTQPSAARSIHIVQQGESLFSISQRYRITVAQLREFNGLTPSDVIIPFQRLYVN
ncbi:MAG: LysM peptidoglycan-binding domain-containing protein [Bacteroidota bacterium]